jgi:hypothetical protein
MPPPPPPHTDREALIAALAAEAAKTAAEGPDPEPEELLDYLDGKLAPEDEERIARHLAASPEAAEALLDLADFQAATTNAGAGPADLAARAAWRDLQSRLPAPRSRHPPAWLSTLAAALLVLSLGLGFELWRVQGGQQRLVANVRSLELPPESRAGNDPETGLPTGAPLRLVLAPAVRCPVYEAELAGPGSRGRQRVEDLEQDDLGRLTILMQDADPGTYTLRLTGCEPRREIEEHRFRITADE